jgi:hypothetical protein
VGHQLRNPVTTITAVYVRQIGKINYCLPLYIRRGTRLTRHASARPPVSLNLPHCIVIDVDKMTRLEFDNGNFHTPIL